MSVLLHEVIEAFANTIEGQSGECVAELRDGSGRPLDIVSAMRDWADTLRTPHKPKRRPRYEYRFDGPDNFNYEEWIVRAVPLEHVAESLFRWYDDADE